MNSINKNSYSKTNSIEKILEKSVKMFFKIGLVDLAQKWDTILCNYRSSIQTT